MARQRAGAAQRGVYPFFFDGDVADLRRARPLGLFKSFTRGGHFVRFFELLTEPPHVVLLSESSDATRAEYDRFGGVGIPMLHVAGQSKLKSRQGFHYRKHPIQVLLLRANDLCFGATRAVEPVGERA